MNCFSDYCIYILFSIIILLLLCYNFTFENDHFQLKNKHVLLILFFIFLNKNNQCINTKRFEKGGKIAIKCDI